MYLDRLALTDYRSYTSLELQLQPGVTVIHGLNGVGKTNIVEAIGYLATLGSHRVPQDSPLIRFGADQAIVRGSLIRQKQNLVLEVEINAERANRARINRANPVRAREILGLCRMVLFAPEDLALVKGDPSFRRRFLDENLQSISPRFAGLRQDYERVLKQRNALLRSAKLGPRRQLPEDFYSTLEVWDEHLIKNSVQLMKARASLVRSLEPYFVAAYSDFAGDKKQIALWYRSSLDGIDSSLPTSLPDSSLDDYGQHSGVGTSENLAIVDTSISDDALGEIFRQALLAIRQKEIERGLSLLGPHRDELELRLGGAPVKGYASHGETWSSALALRLASYRLLLEEQDVPGADPILILDDVFAELDQSRREKLADVVSDAEQVFVTAAVEDDVPAKLKGHRLFVPEPGVVRTDETA